MAFMEPQSLRPLPKHYYSPTYRGAATDVGGTAISTLYKSRKMEGTLGGVFNVLLAGERASGTAIYGARKKLGFGAIDWIEQAEPGSYGYRRISPSEALGLRGYDDKFWTARGITSLALDIVLDPTTYIGVGLVGKTAKLGGMAAKGFGKRSVRVGAEGIEFMAGAQGRGLSKEAAEKQLIDYMSVSTTVQASMMARTGPTAVKFMGRPIMETSRVTRPAGRLWGAAPYLESRTAIMENLRTKFQVFHRVKRQVGEWAAEPYEEYYRRTGVGRSQWNKMVYHMSKGVPDELYEPTVRYLDTGVLPATNAGDVIKQANRYKKEVDRMAREEVGAGILDPSVIREHYYARLPTEAAMRYTERKMGKDFGAGLTREETVAKYIRSLGAAHQRTIKGDIFEAERYMTGITGVKNWYVMNPYESLQRRGVSSIMSLESDRLLKTMQRTMGIRAVGGITARYTPTEIDKIMMESKDVRTASGKLIDAEYIIANLRLSENIPVGITISEAKGMVRPGVESAYRRGLLKSKWESPIPQHLMGTGITGISPKQALIKSRAIREQMAWGKIAVSSQERAIETYTRLLSGDISYAQRVAYGMELKGATAHLARTRKGIKESESHFAMLPAYEGAVAYGRSGMSTIRRMHYAAPEKMLDAAAEKVITRSGAEMATYGRKLSAAEAMSRKQSLRIAEKERRLVGRVTTAEPSSTMWKDDIFYKLKGGYYIPSEALAEYTRRVPTTGWWSRQETKFKKTLTSIWPAFHARNLYGMALWQNVLAGVDPRAYAMNLDIMRKTSPWMKKHAAWAIGDVGKMYDIPFMGKKTAAQLRTLAEEREVYGITGMVDVATTYTTKGRWLGRVYEQVPQEVMVGVESTGRGAIFWDRIMKGVPVEKASKDVEKFHFRYGPGGMTEFESEKLRHVFLFYRWMRGNIPLQAQMSIEKPYMYAGLGKIHERAHTPESRDRLAPWQKERFGFTVGNTFVSLDLPFYEHPALLAQPSNWEDLYFAMTPAIKYPVGMLAGKDPATGAPIESFDDMKSYTASQFMGRGVYAHRELEKTWSGERPLSWTALHQFGGVGVYELSPTSLYSGMTSMPRMPAYAKKMGMTQDKWTEYQMARGWTPKLTDLSRAEIHQQHGGVCSVCGRPCSPTHPCSPKLIVQPEDGGTYTASNTALVCSSCSGTFTRSIAPMMRESIPGYLPRAAQPISFAERDKIYGVMDEYFSMADAVE